MLSLLSRSYSVLHAGSMVALIALYLNYLTGVGIRNENVMTGEVKHVNTRELVLDKSMVDRALLELRMKYDLRGAFNWSTHIVFLYVTANYENNRHSRNEVVIFDKILTNSKEAFQPGTNTVAKYYLYDYGRGLRNKEINLKFFYEVVPLGGFIKQFQLSDHKFKMLSNYTTNSG